MASIFDLLRRNPSKDFFRNLKLDSVQLNQISLHLKSDMEDFDRIRAELEHAVSAPWEIINANLNSDSNPVVWKDLGFRLSHLSELLTGLVNQDATLRKKVRIEAFDHRYFEAIKDMRTRVEAIRSAGWPKNPKNRTMVSMKSVEGQYRFVLDIFKGIVVPEGTAVRNKYNEMGNLITHALEVGSR